MVRKDKPPAASSKPKFWEKPLTSLNKDEWENLCDGCGKCCLKIFEDEETGQLARTRIACRYFRREDGRCSCYKERTLRVPDCMDVSTLDILASHWMPETCAYRLRAEGKPLPDWHPLISGSRDAMEKSGNSIQYWCISEDYVHPDGMDEHVISWVNGQGARQNG